MPPIRHLVLFRMLASAPAPAVETIISELSALPSVIPNILYYRVIRAAPTLSQQPAGRGFSLMIDSVYKDAAALSVYAPHPAHQAVVAKINAVREDGVIVDYELPAAFNIDAYNQLQRPPHVRHILCYELKAAEEEAAIVKQAAELQHSIPGVLDFMHGKQDNSRMGAGYADRSKGMPHAIEFVVEDKAAMEAFRQHPEYARFVKERGQQMGQMQAFEYEM